MSFAARSFVPVLAVAATLGLSASALASVPPTDAPAGSTPQADIPTAGDAELAAVLAEFVSDDGPTSVAAAVFEGDNVRVAVAGTVSADDDTPVSLDARHHLGSDTKAMTAFLLVAVLDEYGFDLDSTLGEILPDVEIHPDLADVTMAELLAHESGLVDGNLGINLELLAAGEPVASRDEGVRAVLAQAPDGDRGTFAYSNVGYTTAGWIAEYLTGSTYRDLMTERIFEPLGLTCEFGAPTGPTSPIGHDATGRPDGREDPNPELIDPAGRISCSLDDWLTFARMVVGVANGDDNPVVPSELAARLLVPPTDGGYYAGGWGIIDDEFGLMLSHDGSNTHWYARIILVPEADAGLLMVANAGSPEMPGVIEQLGVEIEQLIALEPAANSIPG